jgi:hypothetical protein
MQPKEEPPMDIVSRIEALLSNTPSAEIEEFEVTRCLRDCRDEIIAARACAEMMLQGTGQPLAERMAKRVLDDITDAFAGVPRWILASERMPEAGEYVLACRVRRKDGMATAVRRELNGKTVWSAADQWNEIDPPIAWMPLPEPPEAK